MEEKNLTHCYKIKIHIKKHGIIYGYFTIFIIFGCILSYFTDFTEINKNPHLAVTENIATLFAGLAFACFAHIQSNISIDNNKKIEKHHREKMDAEENRYQKQMEIEENRYQKQMEIEENRHQKQMETEKERHTSEFAYTESVNTIQRVIDKFNSTDDDNKQNSHTSYIAWIFAHNQIEHLENLEDYMKTDETLSAWESYKGSLAPDFTLIFDSLEFLIENKIEGLGKKQKISALEKIYTEISIESDFISKFYSFYIERDFDDSIYPNVYAYYEYAKQQKENEE